VTRLFGARNRRRASVDLRAWLPGMSVAGRAAAALVVLAVLLACWPFVRETGRRHPYFAVREIVIRHRGRLTDEALRAASGIEPYSSIWDVDSDAVEKRLLAVPWVRSASVRRELPNRVVMQVREHRPAAIVATDGPPVLYYVAANGHIFAPVGPTDSHDFPYLTGLAAADLSGASAYGPHAVRRALALLRLLGRGTAGLGTVSEIHIDRTTGFTLLPMRPPVPVELGWEQLALKLERLARVLPLWTGREADMTGVSCFFDDQVIVRTRAPEPPAKPRRATRT
jgi:cell division septal protein FtsQ